MNIFDCFWRSNGNDVYPILNNLMRGKCEKEKFQELIPDVVYRKPNACPGQLEIKIEDNDFDIFMIDNDGNDYSIMFMDRDDILALSVHDKLIEELGYDLICAFVLYEMIWYGYDEKDMVEVRNELGRVDNNG